MGSTNKFLLRLSLGTIKYGYPDAKPEYFVSQECIQRCMVAALRYCHQQSSKALAVCDEKNTNVRTILQDFHMSSGYALVFGDVCLETHGANNDIAQHLNQFQKSNIQYEGKMRDGQVLVAYCEIMVLCFTIGQEHTEQSTPQYLFIPNSEPVVKCMSKDELNELAECYALEGNSWSIVSNPWNIPTCSVATLIQPLSAQIIPALQNHALKDGEYKIFNKKWDGPLFCGDGTDESGDHWGWIEPQRSYENQGKERMMLEKQNDGTYKIYNKKHQGAMFCGDSKDSDGDHWAWFSSSPSYESQGKEKWIIEKQSDGFYKIFNRRYGGPLFCGDGTDSLGDHWAWVHPNPDYDGNGKGRWEFQLVGAVNEA